MIIINYILSMIWLSSLSFHLLAFAEMSQVLKVSESQKSIIEAKCMVGGVSFQKEDNFLSSGSLQVKPGVSSVINYDAPFAQVAAESLTPLEDFFEIKELTNILQMFRQIASLDSLPKVRVKHSNCFLLYSQKEIDLSAVAQVIAQKAGYEILYFDARNDFRTYARGTQFANLDEFFMYAHKMSIESGRQIAILIDGLVDSPFDSMQIEKGLRNLGPFITALGRKSHGVKVPILCTTYYPERIDPLIMWRFNIIEVPAHKSSFSLSSFVSHWKDKFFAYLSLVFFKKPCSSTRTVAFENSKSQ